MAIRSPYDFPQDPATHPDGEKIVSVADPIGSAPGNHTYYLARRFNFAEGNYTIALTADDAATVWIGTTQLNLHVIASPTLEKPATAYINIPQGEYRIDVILTNLPAAPSPCYFTMIIKRGEELIYASDKDGWLLDDTQISDDDLPPPDDYRFKLPMFTVLPNWKNGVRERLSWLTDVMDSETSAEQRRSVRRNARREFEADFLRKGANRNRLDDFMVGIGPAEFMMPLWHEAVRMEDGISMEALGVSFPDGELRFREFRQGDLVFVNANDPTDYDILQVGDVEENRFSWAFPPPRPWPIGTRIYPMRQARMLVNPVMSNITDQVSTATIQFTLSEPYKIDAAWGGSIEGNPYFRFNVDRADPIGVNFGRKNFSLDNGSGPQVVIDHGRFTWSLMSTKVRLFTRANAYAFRQFLQSARGRAVHFFAPTFMQDVYLAGDVPEGAEEIVIQGQGFYEYMLRPQPIRLMLAFQFSNGSPTIYATITNVSPIYATDPDGSLSTPLRVVNELLSLDTVLPEIQAKSLHRISFVAETRFDQDAFELFHPTNQQAVVDCALVLRQAFNQRIPGA